jgi:hypothetical protein
MADLPEGFNNIEHLQASWNSVHNKRVDRYFKDVDGNGDLSSVRASLKLACRALDNDNHYVSWMRADLFYAQTGYNRKDLAVIYGNKFDTAPPVAGHPQLFIYFSQDASASTLDEPIVEHEKSCRLMKFSCSAGNAKPAITKTEMVALANEIKTLFTDAGKGITYVTGNKSASYTDPENGFPKGNYLLANSKADAIKVYKAMCNAVDVTYRGDSHIIFNDPDKPSTTRANAGTTTIIGKTVKNRRYRPIATLRFRYAYISLGNLVKPIFLVDTTYRYQALVRFP